jgi:desulfoferrodoxin-like iron-binding protein
MTMTQETKGVSRRSFLGAVALGAVAVGTGKALGLELTPEVFRAKDPANLSGLEKAHVPHVTLPARVAKGESTAVAIVVEHPMVQAHFIGRLEVYWEGTLLSVVTLVPDLMDAKATVAVKFPGPGRLAVRILCNLHGAWEAEQQVQVS